MLVYVESKAFPCRTFVVRIQPYETIARVRAQLLHILYELGRADHQFRLRYRGQFLRDAFTLEDYDIVENAILRMLPLSKRSDSCADLKSLFSYNSAARDLGIGQTQEVKDALEEEVKIFQQREGLIRHFNGLQYLHFLSAFLAILTTYWYGAVWCGVLWLFGAYYCPVFTRTGGFIGKQSIYKNTFCIVYGTLALLGVAAGIYISSSEWIRIVRHGCPGFLFVDDCSHQVVYTAIFYGGQSICLLISASLAWMLLWNMKIEYGDYVEKHLVQSRDVEELIAAARSGGTREKRVAAFELATMAASGDDNKFRIVAEEGMDVLTRLALCKDDATQEHAVEAIAELLTIPAIQDTFVESGGVRTLTALLHSRSPRVVHETVTALSYIVADSDENQFAVVADHGLHDLCHAAVHAGSESRRLVAGVMLDLAFTPEIRQQMAAANTPSQALISLVNTEDPDTQRFSLQTLELLAIESAETICAQTCERMLEHPSVHRSLTLLAKVKDPIIQKVVIKVIYCACEWRHLKLRARELNMGDILKMVRENAVDREIWDMADQALGELNSDDPMSALPPLTTAEKLNRLDDQAKNDLVRKLSASRASVRSSGSIKSRGSFKQASSSDDSIADLKGKGLM